MNYKFTFSEFTKRFPDDESCLEEIKRLRFPNGIDCVICRNATKHYRLQNRMSYACKFCRQQVYPLKNTIFEKTSTPLTVWFYAIYLMTATRAEINARQLQEELKVTYKTAWRMYTKLKKLMEQNNGDLLSEKERGDILHWTFFNKLEIKITQRKS